MRLVQDRITCNACIRACGKGGQWQLALSIFRSIPDGRVIPTLHNYNSIMDAVFDRRVGYALLKEVIDRGIYRPQKMLSDRVVDLRVLPVGLVVMAAYCWLLRIRLGESVRGQLNHSRRLTLITGNQKAGNALKGLLRVLGLPAVELRPGCLTIDSDDLCAQFSKLLRAERLAED